MIKTDSTFFLILVHIKNIMYCFNTIFLFIVLLKNVLFMMNPKRHMIQIKQDFIFSLIWIDLDCYYFFATNWEGFLFRLKLKRFRFSAIVSHHWTKQSLKCIHIKMIKKKIESLFVVWGIHVRKQNIINP
jgi:hypothetical protein